MSLPGWGNQIQIDVTENGGGPKDDYSIFLEAYYNCCPIKKDSINQFLYRPAIRYSGIHNRTYIVNVSNGGVVTMQYWDEDDKSLSASETLDSGLASNDHNGGSIVVLQHQGDAKDGTIMCVYSNNTTPGAGGGIFSIRSDNVEDISSWGDVNDVDDGSSTMYFYPTVYELGDGTVIAFWSEETAVGDTNGYIKYSICTLGADPDDDAWSAEAILLDTAFLELPYYKTWMDSEGDIHFCFSQRASGGGDTTDYTDVYYARWDVSTNSDPALATWYEGDGSTTISIPMDGSDAAHTPDLVYESQAGEDDIIWDIKTDGSNSPYILFCHGDNGVVLTSDREIHIASYSAGWNIEDTGATTHVFGTWGKLLGGAEIDPDNMSKMCISTDDVSGHLQIQMWEDGDLGWQIADGTNGTTAICTDGKITEASSGDNFRPIYVLNGAGLFKLLWFYGEKYTNPAAANGWETMRMAYPGFSNGNCLGLGKNCRTDFGDLRFTTDDGSTYLNDADGKPWIWDKTDSWQCLIWIGKFEAQDAGGTTSIYAHYGNGAETNDNDQEVLVANFLAGDHFENGTTLDTDQWDEYQGTVTVASHHLVLSGNAVTRGIIQTNTANFADIPIGAMVISRWYASNTSPSYAMWGLIEEDDSDPRTVMFTDPAVANKVYGQNCNSTPLCNQGFTTSYTITSPHTWFHTWKSGQTKFYHYAWNAQDEDIFQDDFHTEITYVPTTDKVLQCWEASVNNDDVYLDYIVARPWTDPEQTVNAREPQSSTRGWWSK